MKTRAEIDKAIRSIEADDDKCQCTAHKDGRICLDVGHAIRGTWLSVLLWVSGEKSAPWE